MSANDGGPAFPTEPRYNKHGQALHFYAGHYGMSLRDYFAAAALRATMTQLDSDTIIHMTRAQLGGLAHNAYFMADAMLAEREKDE